MLDDLMMPDRAFQPYEIDSPVGKIAIFEYGQKIIRIWLAPEFSFPTTPSSPLLSEAGQQIQEYLEGKRRTFSLPLISCGSPFYQRVWDFLPEIPYGEVMTYQDVAIKLGDKKLTRAVGSACHANPVPLLIPCHRVVGQKGNLTGYNGGLEIKQFLLDLEARQCATEQPDPIS